MKLPLTIKEIEKLSAKSTVTLNGWIRSVRHQKKLSFANVSDGTADIQVLLPPDSHRGYVSHLYNNFKAYIAQLNNRC